MSEMCVRYRRDDAPNGTGVMTMSVSAHGFSGVCESYVSERWIGEFAARLRVYPLPDAGVADEAMIDGVEGFSISVAPAGSLGVLVVAVGVRHIHRQLQQVAEIRFATDYASLDRFSRALIAAARAGDGEARIEA